MQSPPKIEMSVSKAENGLRLLTFLRRHISPDYSNKVIKRSIDNGFCQIQGKVEKFSSYKVQRLDKISFDIKSLEAKKASNKSLEILFEDEYLLVCNKPSGMVCNQKDMPYFLVHRLDKQTSGVLILAKNEEMQKSLEKLFYNREVKKKYFAVVQGNVKKKEGTITSYLEKKIKFDGQTTYGTSHAKRGKEAITSWRCLEARPNYSLVECFPKTGRTHQLRVHLKEMGYPIMGDTQYAPRAKFFLRTDRFLLHAKEVSFTHPKTMQVITVESAIPEDILNYLEVVE